MDHVPLYWHPINPIAPLRRSLSSVNNDISRLPPQSLCLLYCIASEGALLSTHEAIVGPGAPALHDLTNSPSGSVLQELGFRRQATCAALQAEALRLARIYGITIDVSEETAAACFILSMRETSLGEYSVFAFYLRVVKAESLSRDADGASEAPREAFRSAYVSHVRILARDWEFQEHSVTAWSCMISHVTMIGLSLGQPSSL